MPGSPLRTTYFSKTKYFFFETRHSLARGERKALLYIFFSFFHGEDLREKRVHACVHFSFKVSNYNLHPLLSPFFHPPTTTYPQYSISRLLRKGKILYFPGNIPGPPTPPPSRSAATANSEFPPHPPFPAKRIVYSHKTDLGRPWGLMHLRQRVYVWGIGVSGPRTEERISSFVAPFFFFLSVSSVFGLQNEA